MIIFTETLLQGAGRAVTQANSSTATDSTNGQSDEHDDLTDHRISLHRTHKSRSRSHSLSIGGRQERGEKLGVLKTVQMHARSRHAFAPTTPSGDNITAVATPQTIQDVTHPALVRRNSTSAHLTSESFDSLHPPPTSPSPAPRTLPATDPAAPQSTQEPVFGTQEDTPSDFFLELKAARNSKNAAQVLALVQRMRALPNPPHTAEFNMALEELHETRRAGEPLNLLLTTYNDMIKLSVVPNTRTYLILILALTDRDHEIHRTIVSLEARSKRRLRSEPIASLPDQQRIEQLRSENNFGSAMALFEAASAIAWNRSIIPVTVYANLLRSCAYHSNVDAAIHVFAHLERRSDLSPSASIFSHLISVYTNIGDLQGAKEVFNEYREAARTNRIKWTHGAMGSTAGSDATPSLATRTSHLIVWNKMIEAHFRCGEYVGGLTLLEQMMDSKASEEFKPDDIPPPASSTFTQIVAGFCQAGDVPSALSWFNRLLEQDATARHPHESSHIPPKPDQVAWMIMMEALAIENLVPDMNRLFAILVQNAGRDGLEVRATDRIMIFEANMHFLDTNKDITNADAIKTIDFVVESVLTDESNSPIKIHQRGKQRIMDQLAERYVQYGDPIRAFNLLEPLVQSQLEDLRRAESLSQMKPLQIHQAMQQLRQMIKTICIQALQPDIVRELPVSFGDVMRVARLSDATGFMPSIAVAPYYLYAYNLAKTRGEVFDLRPRDWELLLYASTALELPSNEEPPQTPGACIRTAALLEDIKANGIDLEKMDKQIMRRVVKSVFLTHGIKELQALFARLGPDYERFLNNPERDSESLRAKLQQFHPISQDAIQVEPSKTAINVDTYHSRFVEEFFPNHPVVSPLLAYSRFEGESRKACILFLQRSADS